MLLQQYFHIYFVLVQSKYKNMFIEIEYVKCL